MSIGPGSGEREGYWGSMERKTGKQGKKNTGRNTPALSSSVLLGIDGKAHISEIEGVAPQGTQHVLA
jgi:hypothetical protein